jgi:hypothetical protein
VGNKNSPDFYSPPVIIGIPGLTNNTVIPGLTRDPFSR